MREAKKKDNIEKDILSFRLKDMLAIGLTQY